MLGLKLDKAKAFFFDREAVMDATTRAERRVLSRFGAFVRTRARTSIRPGKGISQPGQPPRSHAGHLRRGILFAYEPESQNVVIGPTRLNSPIGDAPAALEHGGPSERVQFVKGQRQVVQIEVEPRPYMQPAFEQELPGLDALWANAIRS